MKKIFGVIVAFILTVILATPLLTACAATGAPDGAVLNADTFNTILQTLVTAVVIPALIFLGKAAFDWLKTKTTNATLNKYIAAANDAVNTAVAETMQTFVSTLKASGQWNDEAAKKALLMAKNRAVELMGAAALKALPSIVDDFQTWLTSKVEAATYTLKMASPCAPTAAVTFAAGV